jgi:hypothetical protein
MVKKTTGRGRLQLFGVVLVALVISCSVDVDIDPLEVPRQVRAVRKAAEQYNRAVDAGSALRSSRGVEGDPAAREDAVRQVVKKYEEAIVAYKGIDDKFGEPTLKAELAEIKYRDLNDPEGASALLQQAIDAKPVDWVWPDLQQLFPASETYPSPLASAVESLHSHEAE